MNKSYSYLTKLNQIQQNPTEPNITKFNQTWSHLIPNPTKSDKTEQNAI